MLHTCFEAPEIQELYGAVLTEDELESIYGWTVVELCTEYNGSDEPYTLIKIRPSGGEFE